MIMLGNKVDLSHLKTVKQEEHDAFAKSNGILSYCCSAKTGDQIQPVFYQLAGDLSGLDISAPVIE